MRASRGKTQSGRESLEIVEKLIGHLVSFSDTQTRKMEVFAFVIQADGWEGGHSKKEEIFRERCGPETKQALEQRIADLGLKIPESPWKINRQEAAPHDENLISNLNAAIAALTARYGDGEHPEIIALRAAIRIIKS